MDLELGSYLVALVLGLNFSLEPCVKFNLSCTLHSVLDLGLVECFLSNCGVLQYCTELRTLAALVRSIDGSPVLARQSVALANTNRSDNQIFQQLYFKAFYSVKLVVL